MTRAPRERATLRSRAAACAAALLLAVAARAGEGGLAPWPETLTGVAEAKIVSGDERFSTRLAFAAAIDPPRLRIEVVKGGTLQALAWYDERRVIVLAPGSPALVHEGPPTRETLEKTLGLPFCPAEIFAALRGGLAPALACGPADARATDEGLEVGAGGGDGRRASLKFSRYRRESGRAFPHRVVLDSDLARATIDILVLQESPKAPAPPSDAVMQSAARVGAEELADALGLVTKPARSPAPAPEGGRHEGGLGR